MPSYTDLINSDIFKINLIKLNNTLKKILIDNNYEPVLEGNLFYNHLQINPPFYESELLDHCEEKRIRLNKAALLSTVMFEIGLNGGHSSFLSLLSNDNLKVYSNDIAEFFPPIPTIHPELYVSEAAKFLSSTFGDRFTFIKGSCLNEVPNFVKNNPNILIDLVHIDGAKYTYENDFFNILPILKDGAFVIFDDSNLYSVQQLVNDLIEKKYLQRTILFPKMNDNIRYRNEILIYKKQ